MTKYLRPIAHAVWLFILRIGDDLDYRGSPLIYS